MYLVSLYLVSLLVLGHTRPKPYRVADMPLFRCDYCRSPCRVAFIHSANSITACELCQFDSGYDFNPPEYWVETDSEIIFDSDGELIESDCETAAEPVEPEPEPKPELEPPPKKRRS